MVSSGSYVFVRNYQEVFYKKLFLKNFTKFKRKYFSGVSFLIKLEAKENTYFLEHLPRAASAFFRDEKTRVFHSKQMTEAVVRKCSVKKVFLEISQNS